jgi:CRP-like cAMP-binding protein
MNEGRLKLLQETPIFGGLREEILESIVADSVHVSLSEGEFLFVENAPGNSMYVLEKGRVAILKLWNNDYYRLNFLNAGDCIGEMSLIDLGRRSASVLAVTDCNALELTNATLFKVYERDLEQFTLIQMNMSRELSRRLRTANDTLFQERMKSDKIPKH